jgi:DNA-binding transcriptional LysR family regulator
MMGVIIVKTGKESLNIKSLQYFISAAENLNFTRAAKECYITQTAMSVHIAKMEEDIGFQLFRRDNRKVVLTSAGKEFYQSARKIVKIYEDAVEHSSGVAEGITGVIRILFGSAIEALFLMPYLKQFKNDNPAINIDVHLVKPGEIMSILKQQEADVAFSWPYDFETADGFSFKVVEKATICAAMGVDNPLAKKYKSIKLDDLKDNCVVIIGEGGLSNSYQVIYSKVLKTGFNISCIIKAHTLEEILLNLEMDYGVALLPNFIRNFVPDGHTAFLDIEDTMDLIFDLAAIYDSNNSNQALQKFIDILPQA